MTIIHYPGKYDYEDISNTTSENFYRAYEILQSKYSDIQWLDKPIKLKTEVQSDEDEEEYNDVDYGDEDADFEPEDLATEDDEVDYGDEDS